MRLLGLAAALLLACGERAELPVLDPPPLAPAVPGVPPLPDCAQAAIPAPDTLPPPFPLADGERPCHESGYCWWNFPQGARFSRVSGTGPDDVWAAGTWGTLVHFDGARWTGRWTGSFEELEAVWSPARGTAYALTFHGSTWRIDGTSAEALDAGWPASSWLEKLLSSRGREAWVSTGYRGPVLRFDGERWSPAGLGEVQALWAPPSEGLVIARDAPGGSELEHRSAGGTRVRRLPGHTVYSLSGIGPDTIWATSSVPYGSNGLTWDGQRWRELGRFGGLALGTGPGEVWFGDTHLTGPTCTHHPDAPLDGRWASGPSDVWGPRDYGAELVRWDGARWTIALPFRPLRIVGSTADGERAWALRGGADGWHVAVFDGRAWQDVPGSRLAERAGVPVSAWTLGVHAPSPDAIWIRRGSAPSGQPDIVERWDGSTWRPEPVPAGAIAGTGPEDVWVVDRSATHHWDGSAWTARAAELPAVIMGAWAPAPGVLFALAPTVENESVSYVHRGTDVIWRWTGAGWEQVLVGRSVRGRAYPLPEHHGTIWGAVPWEGWATGVGLYRYDGERWAEVDAPPRGAEIRGTAADDVWIQSNAWGDRIAWHWNGATWTRHLGVPFRTGAGAWASDPDGAAWRLRR